MSPAFPPVIPPFWSRKVYAGKRPGLRLRAGLKRAIRALFEADGFLEVETGLVQVSPGNETHLHAFNANWMAPGEVPQCGYLQTSPEFAMKKLLSAGESRIFQFAPVMRAREISALHSPEFTMLEWYRAGADYTALMADCAGLLALAATHSAQNGQAQYRGRTCALAARPERLSLTEAFARHAGISLEATLGDRDGFAGEARRIGVRVADDDSWSDIFSRILGERIEPELGMGHPTILDRYPLSEAALARPCPDDPRYAERFELYVCGVELANAFGELTDTVEQRQRFMADMAEKFRLYGESYPLDEDFLSALAGMPPASGAAMGFDRLAMLTAGATSVHDIRFTPWPFGDEA